MPSRMHAGVFLDGHAFLASGLAACTLAAWPRRRTFSSSTFLSLGVAILRASFRAPQFLRPSFSTWRSLANK